MWVEGKNKGSYLLLDSYSVHMTNKSLTALQDCGTEVDHIVKGYTEKLQVLDVGMNNPFKDRVKACYGNFMLGNVENRKVRRLDVAGWISRAWQDLDEICVWNTWDSIGYENRNVRMDLDLLAIE